MNFSEGMQWLEHFIITEIRHPGVRQRAMLALDAVKQFAKEQELKNARDLDARKGGERVVGKRVPGMGKSVS